MSACLNLRTPADARSRAVAQQRDRKGCRIKDQIKAALTTNVVEAEPVSLTPYPVGVPWLCVHVYRRIVVERTGVGAARGIISEVGVYKQGGAHQRGLQARLDDAGGGRVRSVVRVGRYH